MTVITGQAQVSDLSSTQRAIALDKDILLLEPQAAPLTVFTKSIEGGGNVRPTEDPEFKWVEDEADIRWDAVNKIGGYEAEDTSIVVDTGEVFYKNALVRVPRTGEIFFIKKIETNTLAEVTRGYAGTTAAALLDDDPLFVVGIVAEEGDTSFEARRKAPSTIANYTEITRTSIEESGTAMSSGNLTNPHAWIYEHKKRNIEHLKTIEHKGLFGSKASTTGPNGGTLRTTNGLLAYLTSNNQDMGGTMTETELSSWVRSLTRYGSDTKTVFCSRLALDVISNYAVGRLQGIQSDRDTVYGVKITRYITPNGELKLVPHPLLEGAVWGGYMIAVDFGKAAPQYRYLGGANAPGGSRDTRLLTNRQANDRDGQLDEVLTECGFQVPQPKTGGVATGITG
jgi:hypothetical protein